MQRDTALRDRIAARLAAWPAATLDPGGRRAAAVVLAVADEGHGAGIDGIAEPAGWSDSAALLLTRRPLAMNRHAGQWALPGGRIDAGEAAADAALRELREELGLALPAAALLGRLDDYPTRSGYVITPFVVWAGVARALQPAPDEVASVHRLPLAELLRDDAPILDPPHDRGGHPVLRMPVGHGWIAAPTAALLYQFREVCLLDRPTRVADFDQPRFTWR